MPSVTTSLSPYDVDMKEEDKELQIASTEDRDENGVDLAKLRYNLSLTIQERVEKHRRAAENLIYFRNAARARHSSNRESST